MTAGVEDGVWAAVDGSGGGDGGSAGEVVFLLQGSVNCPSCVFSPTVLPETAGPTLHWCNYKEGLWQINEIPFKWESPASILINSRSIPPFCPNLDQIKARLLDGEHYSTVISTALSTGCLYLFTLFFLSGYSILSALLSLAHTCWSLPLSFSVCRHITPLSNVEKWQVLECNLSWQLTSKLSVNSKEELKVVIKEALHG